MEGDARQGGEGKGVKLNGATIRPLEECGGLAPVFEEVSQACEARVNATSLDATVEELAAEPMRGESSEDPDLPKVSI